MDILAMLQAEVDAVNVALANHQDPSVIYAQLPAVNAKLELVTFGRNHFGADARTVYNAGHSTAIQKAISWDLDGAYAMNVFADHFLEDSFSAGHLRTPRRLLHKSTDITADACAKYMHDEDNAIGIDAKNPAGQSWALYGDKRALDSVNEDNKTRCVDSVQASANEIYKAYQTKQAPSPANYQVWTFAPTLESANAHQTLATPFTFKNERRKTDWWFWSTALECKTSGWWNYPITINGLQNIIPWSAVAVTTLRVWHIHVFYQQPGGGILQSEHLDGWRGGGPSKDPIFNAVRVYYLDEQYFLQEYCYSADQGRWFPGELGGMEIRAATNASIAAMQYTYVEGGVHIRVYCQELASGAIKEFCNDLGRWFRGDPSSRSQWLESRGGGLLEERSPATCLLSDRRPFYQRALHRRTR
ncbi:hypothetical protein EV421DRAFT_1833562 [Armillaria borealis]|uniref:Fucose-specific lectin n=1 Tax=Armillaria borealis TaxID=47425 RepID=A0AA39MJC2_9AGAR|nr:hypothetical protein EV421DRAFT_1833562 [Armillaria borealis]